MERYVAWVHGIGHHEPGYSAEWETAYNEYLSLPHAQYAEICWDTVFRAMLERSADRSAMRESLPVALTPQEKRDEAAVREEIAAILLARATTQAPLQARSRARGRNAAVVATWPAPGSRSLIPPWLLDPDAYLGDFAKYLASRSVRTAIKERAKSVLRSLVADTHRINIIAHSWGTVVAYDSLLDLETELPALRVANLITLGSPLWVARHFLEDSTGRKPGNLASWINIHARGDLVGSWLHPAFGVDKEFEVENFGGGDAHGCYFLPHNEAVQHDIVAGAILTEEVARLRTRRSRARSGEAKADS